MDASDSRRHSPSSPSATGAPVDELHLSSERSGGQRQIAALALTLPNDAVTLAPSLVTVAESLLTFGTEVAFDETSAVVWVNVTGCAHLHATDSDRDGARTLAEKLRVHVASLGFPSRVVIAAGPRVAAALALYGMTSPGARVVRPEAQRKAMATLPLEALPLSDESRLWLERLGLRVVGDLPLLPRASLASRIGENASDVLELMLGEDRAPLAVHVPVLLPEEGVELEHGVEATEALLFLGKRLCDTLGARLIGRGEGATSLELVLRVDRAFAAPDARTHTLSLVFPTAMRDPEALLQVLRVRLDRFIVPGPIVAITLRATKTVRWEARSLSLFEAEAKADHVLPKLVAELVAELGETRVGTLAVIDSWAPKLRSRLLPPNETPPSSVLLAQPHVAMSEPLRWLSSPLPVEMPTVDEVGMRMAGIAWWRSTEEHARDWAWVWMEDHAASAWIEIDRDAGRAWLRGWMDG